MGGRGGISGRTQVMGQGHFNSTKELLKSLGVPEDYDITAQKATDPNLLIAQRFYNYVRMYMGQAYKDIREKPDGLQQESINEGIEMSTAKWGAGDLYRGLRLGKRDLAALEPGAIIDQRGISSWSSNEGVAQSFATSGSKSKNSAVFVDITRGTRKGAVSIKTLAPPSTAWENEVLYSGRSKFEVVSKKLVTVGSMTYTEVRVKER